MYKLFTDKSELFECDIKLEGASLSKSKARLVVETSDYSLLFKGEINSSGKCEIPIRKLKGLIDENTKGNIRLEVIAEDTYFTPWQSDFDVQASKQVTVEVRSQKSAKVIKENKVQVSNVKHQITEQEVNHVKNILKSRYFISKYENIFLSIDIEGGEYPWILSLTEDKLKKFGLQYNIESKFSFKNYQDLINCDEVDIVYIALPNSFHKQWILKAIENNKNILVEKPATINFHEANEIKECLKNRQSFCEVVISKNKRVLPQVKFGRPNEDMEPLLTNALFDDCMLIGSAR
mgnify:CR=1 FL=1